MKKKPWAIILLAVIHIFAPLGNLIMNSLLAGHTLQKHWEFWYKEVPLVLFMTYIVLPILAGVFIFICKRWSYWAYLGCLLAIFSANIYAVVMDLSLVRFVVLIFILLVDLLAVAYFFVPAVKKMYMDPKMRWWESSPRYEFMSSLTIEGNEGIGSCKNISAGGMFALSFLQLKEGQIVSLSFSFKRKVFQINAQVVFVSPRPAVDGYGMKFVGSPEDMNQIKGLCNELAADGKLLSDRWSVPEESFLYWLKNLIVKRQGLFPG